MPHIFMSGHGYWDPKDGFAKVPAGCAVHFYTHFAKSLMTGMEFDILEGKYTRIESTFAALSMVPNLTISSQPAEWTERAEKKLNTAHWGEDAFLATAPNEDESLKLAEMFAVFSMEAEGTTQAFQFHWLACTVVNLRSAGGADIGFNATDMAHQNLTDRYFNRSDRRKKWAPVRGELKR